MLGHELILGTGEARGVPQQRLLVNYFLASSCNMRQRVEVMEDKQSSLPRASTVLNSSSDMSPS